MTKEQVASAPEALDYIVDCTLATVSWMAMLRSRSKSEYRRQISIAQHSVELVASIRSSKQKS